MPYFPGRLLNIKYLLIGCWFPLFEGLRPDLGGTTLPACLYPWFLSIPLSPCLSLRPPLFLCSLPPYLSSLPLFLPSFSRQSSSSYSLSLTLFPFFGFSLSHLSPSLSLSLLSFPLPLLVLFFSLSLSLLLCLVPPPPHRSPPSSPSPPLPPSLPPSSSIVWLDKTHWVGQADISEQNWWQKNLTT